jgi:hypothetical protein
VRDRSCSRRRSSPTLKTSSPTRTGPADQAYAILRERGRTNVKPSSSARDLPVSASAARATLSAARSSDSSALPDATLGALPAGLGVRVPVALRGLVSCRSRLWPPVCLIVERLVAA